MLNSQLQIESLFNVRFKPRWDPHYLIYAGHLGIARAGMASMFLEGQVPKPRLPRAKARVSQRTLKTANR